LHLDLRTNTSFPPDVGTDACPMPTRQCFPTTHRGPGWSRVSMAALWERDRAKLGAGSQSYPSRETEAGLPLVEVGATLIPLPLPGPQSLKKLTG